MKLLSKIKLLSVSLLVYIAVGMGAQAGEKSEADIKREISYYAKMLLDMSGQDNVTVTAESFEKPFLGICTKYLPTGIKVTCVTPGTQAFKAGLLTGDIILSFNGDDLGEETLKETQQDVINKHFKAMKAGDEVLLELLRDGERQTIAVIVGTLSHPAYTLTINR